MKLHAALFASLATGSLLVGALLVSTPASGAGEPAPPSVVCPGSGSSGDAGHPSVGCPGSGSSGDAGHPSLR